MVGVVEYGGAVRQGSGAAGGGGSLDPGNAIMDAFSDLAGLVTAAPPEVLLVLLAIVLVGGLFVLRRA